MARQMVTVQHKDKANGTAVVPESALKFMPGWSVVDTSGKAPVKKTAAKRASTRKAPAKKATTSAKAPAGADTPKENRS